MFSIEVAPQLKTLVLTVKSVQVGVLILFVLCLTLATSILQYYKILCLSKIVYFQGNKFRVMLLVINGKYNNFK